MSVFSVLFPDIAVDIGSEWVRVWVVGKDEPKVFSAYIAVEVTSKRVLAIGKEAKEMFGRVEKHIAVIQPFDHTGVTDMLLARAYFKVVFAECGITNFASFRVAVSVGSRSTRAQRTAMTSLFVGLGARDVVTVASALASAIGTGVPIADASGSFICHIGASRAEVALISLGNTVKSASNDQGLAILERLLVYTARTQSNIELTQKSLLSCMQLVFKTQNEDKITLTGRSLNTRSFHEEVVVAQKFNHVARLWFDAHLSMIRSVLETIPPELGADTLEKGLILTGGIGLVDCADFITHTIGIPVSVPQNPEMSVIQGLHTVLTHIESFKQSLGYVEG